MNKNLQIVSQLRSNCNSQAVCLRRLQTDRWYSSAATEIAAADKYARRRDKCFCLRSFVDESREMLCVVGGKAWTSCVRLSVCHSQMKYGRARCPIDLWQFRVVR